jgi:hypothetical protein
MATGGVTGVPTDHTALLEGYIQNCSGYLEKKTSVLKRWKRQWISIEPG